MAKITPAAYASMLLEKNPFLEADAIVARRNRVFNRQNDPAVPDIDPEQLQRNRSIVQQRVDEVRKQFWSLNLDDLQRKLSDPKIQNVPDVAVQAGRLMAVARLRPEFPKLAQHKRCNGSLFNALKKVVVLSPREAGPEKDELLHQIIRSQKLKACKAMVKMMRGEFTALYSLEKDWLDAISKLKPTKESPEQSVTYTNSGGSGEGFPWWVLWIGFVLVKVILRALMNQ